MNTYKAGDLFHLTRAASVQFVKPIRFRLIRVMDERITYDGWTWIEGYQLNEKGDAVARRELFVQQAGLRKLTSPALSPRTRPVVAAGGRKDPASDGDLRQSAAPAR